MTAVTRSRKMDCIILALLKHGTIHKAAAALEMSEVTVWRWTQKAAFQEAYRKARGEALSRSGARLHHSASAAVATMLKVMVDPSASAAVRLRAADCVLAHAEKTFELEDLEVRLKRVEQATGTKR